MWRLILKDMYSKMQKNKISIIVIIYRVEKYLCQCIESIMHQTYHNLEIILVDDGSDDLCPKICEEYAQKDNRIIVIHKENGGVDSARKAGIQVATGKYVGYVDGDDWIEPEMYEKLVDLAEKNNVKVVEAGIIDSADSMETKRKSIFPQGKYVDRDFEEKIEPYMLYSGRFYQLGIMASLCNKLYERNIIMKYQMLPEPSDNIVDDTFCSIPCVAEAKSVYITHDAYYHYRVRTDSVKRLIRSDFSNIILRCYPEWIMRFPYVKNTENMKQQIKYYLVYLLLMKCIYVFDDQNKTSFLEAYGSIKKTDKVVVYGAGAAGIQIREYIHKTIKENCVLWVDKNYSTLAKTLPIKNPAEILDVEYDYIVIAILWTETVQSAKNDLVKLGVPENKIRWIAKEYIKNPGGLLSKVDEYYEI